MMDTWLRDHLIRAGHLTETGYTRRARLRPCHQSYKLPGSRWVGKCLDLVLVGLDGDTCAFEVACDPQPLNTVGEALSLLEGRRTHTLRREGPGYVLDPRDQHEISFAPAGTKPRRDVVRQHRCGTSPPPPGLRAPTSFPEHHPPLPANAQPPF
jgi:hypothetical protein